MLRMSDKSKDLPYKLTSEEYFFILDRFKAKNSATYHFITKAGKSFQLAILNLFRRFIKNETFPKRFNLTTQYSSPRRVWHKS